MPAMLAKRFVDQFLRVGIGSAAQRQRDGTERQLEQPVSAPRLQVIMPFGCGACAQLDLQFVESDALIGRRSEASRGGKECVCTLRGRWSICKKKKKQNIIQI